MKPYHQQGNVTIYHGDAREILPEVGAVDLVLTDPPYAVTGSKKEWRVTASVASGLYLAAKSVRKGGAMFAFSTSSGRGIEFTLGAVGNALSLNRVLIWHKEAVRSRVAGPWRWDIVTILGFGRACFGRAESSSVFVSSGKRAGDVAHPAELPDGLASWLFTPFCEEAGTVIDPFCGTGQLLRPAAACGKKVIGIEVDERYCEIAAKRLAEARTTGDGS